MSWAGHVLECSGHGLAWAGHWLGWAGLAMGRRTMNAQGWPCAKFRKGYAGQGLAWPSAGVACGGHQHGFPCAGLAMGWAGYGLAWLHVDLIMDRSGQKLCWPWLGRA